MNQKATPCPLETFGNKIDTILEISNNDQLEIFVCKARQKSIVLGNLAN